MNIQPTDSTLFEGPVMDPAERMSGLFSIGLSLWIIVYFSAHYLIGAVS